VESPPIKDKGDGSTWYRLLFVTYEEDDISYLRKPLYINSKFVKIYPLTEYDENGLDWFREGRPPMLNFGDEISEYVEDGMIVLALQKPVVLRKTPDNGAEKITLPKGTTVFEFEADGTDALPAWWHKDVNDNTWVALLGAQNNKALGWIALEEWRSLVSGGIFGDAYNGN
jgi:hypothetical protein